MRLWRRGETRAAEDGEASSADPVVLAALLLQQGGVATRGATAALETACGLWARAFASATVQPATMATAALTPRVLAQIARGLCLRGESVHLVQVDSAGVRLVQAHSWDVDGGYDEAGWRYRVELPGPSRTTTRRATGDEVAHCRYASRTAEPWRGVSPLAATPSTAALATAIEKSLQVDFDGPSGRVFFTGGDERDDDWLAENAADEVPKAKTTLLERLNKMRGGVAFAASNRDTGSGLGLANDRPVSERLGPEPPREVADIREGVGRDVLAACGIPPALVAAGSAGAAREAYRQFVFSTCLPVARLVQQELAAKLDTPALVLRFDELGAADMTGRARAYRQLVDAGMDAGRAGELAGLAA